METESLVPDERRSILWSAAAFDEWVAPHLGVMRGLAARLSSSGEADELVQEALAAAWRLPVAIRRAQGFGAHLAVDVDRRSGPLIPPPRVAGSSTASRGS